MRAHIGIKGNEVADREALPQRPRIRQRALLSHYGGRHQDAIQRCPQSKTLETEPGDDSRHPSGISGSHQTETPKVAEAKLKGTGVHSHRPGAIQVVVEGDREKGR